ncbi:MAG: c-type cytochrome [Pirellulaceae bacterium]|jgi:putative membrane-bound dehydrogenase-like protein|nr:c-type cytochrome [Pirellulaceae bacterium]
MSRIALLLLSMVACSGLLLADEFPEVYNSQKEELKPTTPQQAASMMKVPEGFTVTLFAGEPDVRQPIGAATDARGRLWVAENYTYADRSKNFDVTLRDRIVIFADNDGDGRFDKRTVFWDEGERLTSVAIGFGGVWALCAPNLLFIPDKDRDDVPDGPPVVVLDGWDDDAVRHNIVNGLEWGPDGWLYGMHGILATSHVGKPGATASQRTKINCGLWRYHPTRKSFEVVAHGTTNPWGFDYDDYGEMFMINTVIGHLWHVAPGALYRRMYGAHFRPHAYGVIEQTADHFHWDVQGESWNDIRKLGVTSTTDRAGGGHAHTGLRIYLADRWPAKYRNTLFTANLHGRRLNNDRIERRGNSYVGLHNSDFSATTDPWFRGLEMIASADGNMYVLDWSDIGECHENDGVHRTTGRIFQIRYGDNSTAPPNLTTVSSVELAKLQTSANDWQVRQARRLLQERAVVAKPQVEAIDELQRIYARTGDVRPRLRAMWSLYSMDAVDESWLLEQTADEDEHIRAWAVRLLSERADVISSNTAARFVELAAREPSGLVRLYLASSLNRLPATGRFRLATALCGHEGDATDRVQPWLIWFGVEPIVAERPAAALELAAFSRIPIVRTNIARRLTTELREQPRSLAKLIDMARRRRELRGDILAGIDAALLGWSKAPEPANWAALYAACRGQDVAVARRIGVVFGDGRALNDLRAIAVDTQADPAIRQRAIRTLGEHGGDDLFPLLKKLIGDRLVHMEVIRALAQCDDRQVPQLVLGQYPRLLPASRSDAINTLTSRPAWSLALLEAVENKTVQRQAISAWHARQMNSFNNQQVSARLRSVWGEIRQSSAERLQRIDSLRAALSPAAIEAANAGRGRAIYVKTCANCHTLFGSGGNIGPDLTGANRANLSYLLENMVDPSASVAANFRVTTVQLSSGRVLNGVLLEKTKRTVTLQTDKERVVLDRDDIGDMKTTNQSLMPEGQLKEMSEAKIRDLVAYLMSPGQVPLPSEAPTNVSP